MLNFQFNDAGRSQSKRPKQSNDCTVRALALAFNLDYDAAYDFLAKEGRECSRGFFIREFLDEICLNDRILFGLKLKRISFPAISGQPRMNVKRFCNQFYQETFLLRMSKHVAVVREGILLDTHDCRNGEKCVYLAYQILPLRKCFIMIP